MDFLKYGGSEEKPVFRPMEMFTSDALKVSGASGVIPNRNFYLSRNVINTIDEYLTLGAYTYEGEYYSVGKYINKPFFTDGNLLYKSCIWLHNEQFKMTR
jgi:hypothetical protein